MNRFEKIDSLKLNTEYVIYRHQNNVLFFVSEMPEENFTKEELIKLLEMLGGSIILATCAYDDYTYVKCVSLEETTRAIEFIEYIFAEYGIIKGDAKYAGGKIRNTMLSMCMGEQSIVSSNVYFMNLADKYHKETEEIDSAVFANENRDYVDSLKIYVKKEVPWAFVKSTDIADKGTQIILRSLENDTGVNVTVDDDIYIMIGVKGEVYDIARSKFENTYTISDMKLDIFSNMFDFIPSVELTSSGEAIIIDDYANLCYPKKGAGIKADKLKCRTKVFRNNKTDYFIGKAGDYMAIRLDDDTDIYIIQNEVFERTYEEKID